MLNKTKLIILILCLLPGSANMDAPPSYEEIISSDRDAQNHGAQFSIGGARSSTPPVNVRLTSRPTDDRPRLTHQSSVPEYAQPPRYVRPPPVVIHPTAPPLSGTDAGECEAPQDDSREQLVTDIRDTATMVQGKFETLEGHITPMEALGRLVLVLYKAEHISNNHFEYPSTEQINSGRLSGSFMGLKFEVLDLKWQ